MLIQKASSAVGWSAVNQVVSQGLAFGLSIVLARLIAPEEFGAIAMLMVFCGLADVFVDGGLSPALVQKETISERDKSTAFWFNVCVGGVLTLLMLLSARQIALFYQVPSLEAVAKFYSLQIVLGAACATQNALFARQLDFKTPFRIGMLANVSGAAVGIALAVQGWGLWALAVQAVATALLRLFATWTMSSWRPSLCFDLQSFRKLFGFGSYLFLARLLNVGYSGLYAILIGRWHGAYDLGIYNRANSTQQLPAQSLANTINNVAFPVFSRTQADPDKLGRGLTKALAGVMFINIPMMLGLAALSETIIVAAYGARWAPAAPLLTILAIAGILWPVHLLNLAALQAVGEAKKFMKLELAKKLSAIPLIVVGSLFGVTGLAWATVIAAVIGLFINTWYTRPLVGVGLAAQLRVCVPSFLCGVLMVIAVWVVQSSAVYNPLTKMIVCTLLGAFVYMGAAALFKLEQLALVMSWMRHAWQGSRV